MRKLSLFLLTFFLTCTYLNCSAITVNVKSTNKNIEGLGFTVNGSKHGGMGHSYTGNSMPKGIYAFGLRKSGKDIACLTQAGKRNVKLKSNATAVLMLKNQKCVVKVNS